MSIEAYDYGKRDGIAEERKRISDWVKEHRSVTEIDEGQYLIRDHFDSDSLLEFINEEQKES